MNVMLLTPAFEETTVVPDPPAETGLPNEMKLQPFTAQAAAAKPHHLCIHGCFVNEDKTMRLKVHP